MGAYYNAYTPRGIARRRCLGCGVIQFFKTGETFCPDCLADGTADKILKARRGKRRSGVVGKDEEGRN